MLVFFTSLHPMNIFENLNNLLITNNFNKILSLNDLESKKISKLAYERKPSTIFYRAKQ